MEKKQLRYQVYNMNKIIFPIVILMVSIIPLINLLHPGLPVTHDGQDHVARIANFYQSLSEGHIIPRWAGNLNWGYGHPILMFLYPLPSYVASLFHVLGLSFVDSIKLVFALTFIVSFFTMFLWVRAQWGVHAGFISALLYGFAPYRFVDLYVRGALGEHVAFVFPPLIFLSIYNVTKHNSSSFWESMVSLSIAGLILSHNAVSIMFMPLLLLYLLYLYRMEHISRNVLASEILAIVVGFLISAFFWIPAFAEGKYTLRDIVTKGEVADRLVLPSWFVSSGWNYGGGNQFSKEIGFVQWVGVVLSAIMIARTKNASTKVFLVGLFVVFMLSLFFMTPWAKPIWTNISILQKFQFPWRLLTISVFVAAVLGGVSVILLPKKMITTISLLVIPGVLVSTSHMWYAKSYQVLPESFYSSTYNGTTDTGESSPIWSTRFMEKRYISPLEVIEGASTITEVRRQSTYHEYAITTEKRSRLVDNTLYFPGWRVVVDGTPVGVEFQDPNFRGLLTFWVESGRYIIRVQFKDTKVRIASNIISFIGVVLLLLLPRLKNLNYI